jgi:hypothetical protein
MHNFKDSKCCNFCNDTQIADVESPETSQILQNWCPQTAKLIHFVMVRLRTKRKERNTGRIKKAVTHLTSIR